MESLKLIIVDDEKRVRTSLRHLITMYYPSAEIVAEASDVEEAYSEIIKHSPDVVLLDIQLSGRTGFDLLRKLVPVNFTSDVSCVTAETTGSSISNSSSLIQVPDSGEKEERTCNGTLKFLANSTDRNAKMRPPVAAISSISS